jgi:hypothetical protein
MFTNKPSQTPQTMDVAVLPIHACVMFRIFPEDEFHMSPHDILDWIDYLRSAGVTHFHLYDNCQQPSECQDQLVLQNTVYQHWPEPNYATAQISAIQHCIRSVEQAWVLSCDLDEYPFSKVDNHTGFLTRIVQAQPQDVSQILLRSMFFGGKNLHRSSTVHEPMMDFFKYHYPEPEGEHHRTKPLFRSERTSQQQPNIVHEMIMQTGRTVVADPNQLRLNHYWGARLDKPLAELVLVD